MSYLDEKTLDIVLEDNADFGYRLTLVSVTQECTKHPVTGEDINCKDVEEPIPLDTITFTGVIKKDLEEGSPTLASFSFFKTSISGGIAEMTLAGSIIKTLLPEAESTRNVYNPRLRFLGYYDVMTNDSASTADTRIMQGKVYISDGVTD